MKVLFGPFTFDSEARELLSGGRRVHLSTKAFDLLQLLLERRPGVVNKAEIHERIWSGAFVGDANLTVVVAEIRQALEDDPKDPRYIRTVHRIGYAFSASVVEVRESGQAPAFHRCWLTWNDQTFPLVDGENIIGRDPRSSVWIDASGVSRRHARIVVNAGGAQIEDLASSNGTFVGGKPISATRQLSDQDVLDLGTASLTFRMWSEDRPQKTERISR